MVRDWFRRFSVPGRKAPRKTEPNPGRLAFNEVESTLALYVKALSDDKLKLMSNTLARQGAYSDGRTVFVPPEVDLFSDRQQAKLFYRVTSAWKVLQVRSGSIDLERVPDPAIDRDTFMLYEILSGEWLDREMVAIWPGLAPNLELLRRDAHDGAAGAYGFGEISDHRT
jgi:hypothetical protein